MKKTKPYTTQIGKIFKGMSTSCTMEMTNYSKCVLGCVERDMLDKDVCSKEFDALRKCFRKVSTSATNVEYLYSSYI